MVSVADEQNDQNNTEAYNDWCHRSRTCNQTGRVPSLIRFSSIARNFEVSADPVQETVRFLPKLSLRIEFAFTCGTVV